MSNQVFRLSHGGRIDRSKPISFTFNGKRVDCFSGDTVASALLANGIHFVGRSFKYHRPRGVFSHGSDEPNALVEIDRGPGRVDPNNRATVVEAVAALSVRSQNHWPSLAFDICALSDVLSPLFVVGFYYKTFMWPRSWWSRIYEPRIRKMAGLGTAPPEPDADRYTHRYLHADIMVVGAGPAGLTAALAASAASKTVVIVDEQSEPGGSLLHDRSSIIDGKTATNWLDEAQAELSRRENVTFLRRTTAFGYYQHNFVTLVERLSDHLSAPDPNLPRERLWQVRAGAVILATGSHERPLCFPNNDRPGIMLAESIRTYINRYAVVPGKRVVFVTNGASAYQAAEDALYAGLEVTVVDVRPEAQCSIEAAQLRGLGAEVLSSHTVVDSSGTRRVRGLVVAPVGEDGRVGVRREIGCDSVGLSGGWTPSVHLFSQSRGKLAFDGNAFVPSASVQATHAVGACNGEFDLASCIEGGWRVGSDVIGASTERKFEVQADAKVNGTLSAQLPSERDVAKGHAFVDFQNDVTAKDIALAAREGFEAIEHVKRYTTVGMATDQGKSSNLTAMRLLADARSVPVDAIGTTTFRPPYTPVSFGAIVGPGRGPLFEPLRKTPLHDWALEQGAVFENVGMWTRARYFPKPGETMAEAVSRECLAVRNQAGIFDASTLGKIEVVGPDAAELMNRIYINGWSKLSPGKCRYGVMLKENGFVFDDGVVARLAEGRFHVTTTTGGAAAVLAHMEEYLQTEWPELKVFLTSTTEEWAVIAVQGPRSRAVLEPLVDDIDLSDPAFPHMSIREGRVCGVPTRLFRVSFTGERGYEVNVPAGHARTVWTAICETGSREGITPYGTEAMHVLRAERGFLVIGQDTDGTVTPGDLGLSGMIPAAKNDFIGRRSLDLSELSRPGRKELVGLLTHCREIVVEEGAQVVLDPWPSLPRSIGHITSSYWSEVSKRSIALGLIEDGRNRKGETVHLTTRTGFVAARITEPVFYDAEGTRVHA